MQPLPLGADDGEPVAWLRAYSENVEPRVLPLFRRPARVTVGSGKICDWRFDSGDLAELEVALVWDGVRLRTEDPTRPETRATVRHGQSIVAGASGRLRIALDVVLHDDEATAIRRVPLPPPTDETTAPIPLPPAAAAVPYDDDDQRTVIIEQPVVVPPPRPPDPRPPAPTWRIYMPPRNGAADDDETQPWALDDALRPTADLLDRLGKRGLRTLARRAPPRRLALWGTLALVVAVEAYMLLRPRAAPPPPFVQSAAAARPAAAADRRTRVFLPDKEVERALHRGIADYRAGKTAEAIAELTRVVEDTNDPAARTMLFILRSRGAGAP